jgi:hypothetical protein
MKWLAGVFAVFIALQALDQNRDGAISRAEAAAVPRLVLDFNRIDGDRDGRLTPAEYNAWFGAG